MILFLLILYHIFRKNQGVLQKNIVFTYLREFSGIISGRMQRIPAPIIPICII